jgi:succinoglycan biosynthesis transport protein ExoP
LRPTNGNGRKSAPAPVSSSNGHRPRIFRNLRETGFPGLWLLPSGKVERNAPASLNVATFRSMLADLSSDFDVVILDTPPSLASADAVILAPVADDVLLVVRAGHTDRNAAERAHQTLSDAGGNVVGAVLNDPDGKVPHDRLLYYTYGYPVTSD